MSFLSYKHRNKLSRTLAAAGLCAAALTAFSLPLSADTPKPSVSSGTTALARNKYVEPTNWGKVQGRVYDAATGAPLEGATVTIWQDGVFANTGRTVGKTDGWGSFSCQALLGRVSSNLDTKRLLINLLSPLPGPGVTQRTKRIDVSRLTIRVQKDGYTLYEGMAPCRELDPGSFRVTLEPVLMAASASGEASVVAGGWGAVQLKSIAIEPAILRPGDKATLRAHVGWPAQRDPKDLTLRAQSPVIGSKELKAETARDASGDLVYSTDFTVSKKAHTTAEMVSVAIDRSLLDVARNGAQKRTLLQIVGSSKDDAADVAQSAALRDMAYNRYATGQTTEAVGDFKTLCVRANPLPFDLMSLGILATQTKDTENATFAFSRLKEAMRKENETDRFAASYHYARALLADGKATEAFTEADSTIRSVREQDRQKRVPPELLIVAGEAATQTGDLAHAREMRQSLSDWSITSAMVPSVAPFLNHLRLAESRKKVSDTPRDPNAHAELGRVLLDQSRYAEAVTALEAADKLAPGLPSVRRDITYALLNLEGGLTRAQKNIDTAIADAETAVRIPDPKKPTKFFKSKDFWAWYTLGMLHYTKYRDQTDADPAAVTEANAQMERCQEALVEALQCARSGAKVNEGMGNGYFGYMEDRKVLVAGFAYPQADGVFTLREGLRVLQSDPNNTQALLNVGTALLDLGYADLAADPIARVVQKAGTALPEARFASACITLKTGDRNDAMTQLREVVKRNPRNGKAWNLLARLYTEDGDTAAASECLTAYARVYGSPPDRGADTDQP